MINTFKKIIIGHGKQRQDSIHTRMWYDKNRGKNIAQISSHNKTPSFNQVDQMVKFYFTSQVIAGWNPVAVA